jgi:Ca2+-binding RTX toxin-like protein/outer membrane protein OmpA-like peptidoglycan-associated protein
LKLEPLERRVLLSAELSSTSLVNDPLFETEGSYPPAIVASFSQQSSQALSSDSDAVAVELAPVSQQTVFLDADGALDVDYNGPVHVSGVDVPGFVAGGQLAGQESAVIEAMMASLNRMDFGVNLSFTNQRPESGEYSTVYIGGTGDQFAQWGHFFGLAEDADSGNQIHTDDAFVFSDNIAVNGLSAAQYGEEIARIVAHEVGHLIGTEPAHAYSADDPLVAVGATAIPTSVKEALIGTAADPFVVRGGGLQDLFELAQSIEARPELQVKIPGIDKSVAQLLSVSSTVKEKLQDPIINYFKSDSTPTFDELSTIVGNTITPAADGSFEVTFDLHKLFSDTLHFSLGDSSVGDGSGGFGLGINADIDVDALVALVDSATKTLPTFTFGVDVSNASNPFYVKAETLKLHVSADADPTATPSTGLNFASSLGFLTVSVVNGSLSFDADITVDLSVLKGSDDRITTDEFVSHLGALSPQVNEATFDSTLPVKVQGVPGLDGGDPDTPFTLGNVVVSAGDLFDLTTYTFDTSDIALNTPESLDFDNLDAAGIITMIGQLGDQLDNLRNNGLLDSLDIPLVGDAIDQVLSFADTVRRGLLYDPGADGQKDGADRLVTDLNAALEKAGLGNVIIVQATGKGVGVTTGLDTDTGEGLRFVVIDPTVEAFKITGAGAAFNSFNFDSDADQFDDGAGNNFLIHTADPSDNGVISGTAVLHFTIKRAGVTPDAVVDVTLDGGETSGNTGIGNDTIKLVKADNSATFDSVQGLIFRLLTLADELNIELPEPVAPLAPLAFFGPSLPSSSSLSSALKVIDYKSSDPGKPLIVHIGKFVPALDYVKDLPLDFNLDLGPVGKLTSDAKVTVTAHVGLDPDFGIGIYLGSNVPGADTLESDTLLEDLNGGDGVRIKTAPALTGDNAVPTDAVKAPATDVTFTITIGNDTHTIFVPAAADSGDINITKVLGSQSETAIVVNPRDPNMIVVGANDSRIDSTDNQDRIWVTFNAGKDWQQLLVPVPSDTLGRSRGDPTLAFNEDGTKLVYMHLVRMLADGSGNDSTVVAAAVYSVLTDAGTGAKSLSAGTAVNIGRSANVPLDHDGTAGISTTDRLDLDGDLVPDDDDKEYLAVGKDANGNDLYVVTWHRDHAIYISTSSDALTWSNPMIIGGVTGVSTTSVTFPAHGSLPSGGAVNVPTATGFSIDSIPVIGPDGQIYVVWEDASTQGIERLMFDQLVFDPSQAANSELRLRGVNDTFVNFASGMSKVLADPATSDPGISAADKVKLDNFAALLAGDSHLRATISGYTDSDDFATATSVADDITKNLALSDNRATSVFNYVKSKMTALGVVDPDAQLLKVAYGETKSAAHWATVLTGDDVNEQKNRRVTLTVDRVAYTSNVNYRNDPFNGGVGLDGADAEYEIPAQPSRGIWMGLSVAVDNSSAHHGRIYVSFIDQGDLDGNADAGNATDHNNTDVFVIASDNAGHSWDALLGAANAKTPFSGSTAFAGNQGVVLVKINDDTGTASQFFSWIDVDDTTGDVAVSWYDARNDDGSGPLSTNKQLDSTANDEVEYFASYSTSGGLTWANDIQVSDGLSSAFDSTSLINFGDYTGLSFHDGVIHMAWSDNSNSTKDNPSPQQVPPPVAGRVSTEAYYDLIRVGEPTTTASKLVDDINRAIARAGIANQVHAVLDAERLANGGFRISIEALDSSIDLKVSVANQNDPAVKVLGLPISADATGALVGAELDTERADKFKVTSGDAKFSLTITKNGVATPFVANVTLSASATNDNTTVGNLVTDLQAAINTALTGAGLAAGDLTVAATPGNALVIKINNNLITKVAYKANVANDTPIFELGLPNEAVIVRSHVSATKDLVPVVGRLENDATLTFSTKTAGATDFTDETVTLYADDTASNTTIVSLVDDLNKALSKAVVKTDVLSSFVYDSDISFDLTLTQTLSDESGPAPDTTTRTVTLLAIDTADNTTLDNLVSDLNKALRTAFHDDGWLTLADQLVVAKSSGQTSALGEARIKLEGIASKTVNGVTIRVDKFRVDASPTNELGLPDDYTATNFAGRIKAESIGNKLVFSAIEAGADGFVGPQITDFQLSANAEAADALGLTKKVGGVKQAAVDLPADNTDFVITVTDGTGLPDGGVFRIELDPNVVKDVQDLIDAIEGQTFNNVSVEINDEGGLTLIDNSFDKDSPGPRTFMVAPVNGSAAATDLHIVGIDATNKSDRDGKIVGSSLFGGLALLDRFFMENVQLQANASIATPAAGANFTANVGIVGVNLKATGSLDAAFTIGLKDPAAEGTSGDDDRISLREFGRAFTDAIHDKGMRRLGFLNEATIVAGGGEHDGVDITNLTDFKLAGPATFTLNIGRSLLHPGTDFVVKVDAADTSDNSTIDDLVADVQAAIDEALAGTELEGQIAVGTSLSGNGLKLINNSDKDVFLSDRVALFDRPSLTGLGVLDFDVTVQLGGGLSRFITLPNNGHGSVHLATNLGDLFEHWADDVDLTGANPTALTGVGNENKFTLDGDFTDDFVQGARVSIDGVGGDPDTKFRTFVKDVKYDAGTDKTTVTVIKGVQTSLDTNGKEVKSRVNLPTAQADIDNIKIGTPNGLSTSASTFAAFAAAAETTPDKVVPDFDIAHDLGELLNFDNVQFNIGSLLDALLALRDLLNEFSTGQELLNAPIPLVDVSVNDLLDFAEKFADALDAARANPASSLQFLDKTISEAFGVAVEPLVSVTGATKFDLTHIDVNGDQTSKILEGAVVTVPINATSEFVATVTTVTFTGGKTRIGLDRDIPTEPPALDFANIRISDVAKDLLRFSLDDLGDDDPDNDLLRLDFNLQAAFSKSLNVQIPEINLPGELGGLVDFGGAATLAASGGASFALDVGISLADPTQIFLYDSSALGGTLKLAGSDMAFKAGLGPLSLSIIGGEASIEGIVQASFDPDDPTFTDGRVQITLDNLDDIVDAIEVSYAAPVYVNLPVFFPTESHGIGSVTLTGDLSSLLNIDDAKPQLLLDESAVKAEGTATGGSATTLTASGDEFVDVSEGDIIHIVSGTGAGQTRAITAVDLDTSATPDDLTVTVGKAWQTAPDATSKFAIYDKAITLDLSAVKQGLEDGFSNFSLLDQILIVVDGVDTVLAGVQDVMDGEVLGISMPLIGDKLQGAADVVGDFRAGFLADFRAEVEKLAVPNQDGIKDILFKLLGPQGLNLLIKTNVLASGTVDDAAAIGATTLKGSFGTNDFSGKTVRITSGAGAGQLRTIVSNTATTLTVDRGWITALDDDPDNASTFQILGDAETEDQNGHKEFKQGTEDDILSYNNLAKVNTVKDAEIWWTMKIGDVLADAGGDIGFDIGIPGLGLKTEGDITLDLSWELDLGFGLSGKDGFFFFINDGDELLLKFDVNADAGLTGSLGFLQFTAHNQDVDGDDNDGNTHLTATIAVDLNNKKNAADERLGLSELGNLGFDVLIAADASVELAMTLGLTGDQGSFPELQANFFLDWAIDGNPNVDGSQPISLFNPPEGFSFGRSIQDGLKFVGFKDVGLDLGTYISNVVKPILEKIQDITEPVQPIIDIVTTPLPILSDLGLDITLLDIAKMTGLVNPALITAIETIADVITLIDSIDVSEGSLIIPIGDFTIYEAADRDLIDSAVAGLLGGGKKFDLGSGSFDMKAVSGLFKPGGQLATELGNISPVLGEIAGVAGDVLTNLAAANGVGPTAKPFKFDILEDPTSIFGLLMGEDVTLVSYDMAPLKLDGEFTAFFSIFGPLGVSINLEAKLNIDFAFGYDTRGLVDFADSGFRNPLLLLDGLYVDDDPTPSDPSDGKDPPELTFDAGLWAAAELNLGIARGGVGGGLFFHSEFNLFDNDGDGRVRLDELATNFLNQLKADGAAKLLAPLAIFDVTGKLTAELFAFLKIDFGFFELDKRFNITPPVTLADFNVNFNRPPVLASELDNGDLIINIGEFAKQRELGDLTDFGEHIKIQGDGVGKVLVSSDNLEDGGAPQSYKVTGKIIISAGEGDDVVELDGIDPGIRFDIDAGAGDDTITASGGGGIIHGRVGNDTLTGSDSADLIFGDEGDDVIDGAGGDDILLGDKGEVSDDVLTTRHGFVRALVSANDGVDTIDGGGGDDVIAGSGGADKLKGGANNDLIIGDGGLFTYNSPPVATETDKGQGAGDEIEGGDGDDLLYGGKGDDLIYGDNADGTGTGQDTIFGESGGDELHGGADNDTIFGDFGTFRLNELGALVPAVQVASGEGADKIFGDDGNDKLLGGGGNDDMHGGANDDTMWGGVGADVMHGDGGADTIFGETDRDQLFGDAGGDYLEGGAGNDFVRGGTGNDLLIAGYGSDDLDGQAGEDTYRITARGGLVTELTTIYDSGINGEGQPPDHLVLIGTSQADTVLLRGMADYYFPLLAKLTGGVVNSKNVDGLTDKIFASQEPDKLRAVLQALEDSYGPHAVANVVHVDGADKTLDKLYEKIVEAYTDAVHDGVMTAVNAETQAIKDRVESILGDATTGLFPGKLEEIVQAIKLAYGVTPLPGDLINNVNKAWDTVGTVKGQIETIIGNAYRTEMQVLGTDTDTGFVALLNNGGSDVERFNYRNIEDITVNTLDGNDYVVLDDVLAPTTVNLGLGEDRAQVGQVFRSERVRQFDDQPLITGIKAEDVFTTLEITRGWLSNGVSQATVINGEDGNDQFTVFHNIAVLNLNGGDGDDFFTVRAFALKGSSDSERARTDMKGDGGADTILYVLNAPVGIDGGDGFDTVRIIGTEFSDDFVVTDDGVFGGGLNVSYVNIEKLIADGAEGNDRFFVMSTGNEVVTEIDGGLGSDTFFVGGNPSGAPVSVVSNDFKGHSGIILHSIEEGSDPSWIGTPIEGVSANIGDNEEEMALVVESQGFSRVREGALSGEDGFYDSYTIRLTKAPTDDVQVTILQAGMSPTDEARGFKGLQFLDEFLNPLLNEDLEESDPKTGAFVTPVLTFTTSNWATAQTVRFKAAPDDASEGQRFVFINHLLKDSADLVYRDVKTLSVKVQIDDDDRKSVIITPSGRDNMVVEDGDVAGSGRTDTFDVVLSHQPTADVTVKLKVLNNQITLAHNSDPFVGGELTLTFTSANWHDKQTVTITAPNDSVVEGFHTDTIRYTVTSDDKEQTLHSGGAPDTQIDVDGDFDLPGIQPTIPDAKPTDYVLLQHRPIVDSVRVFLNGNELPDGTVDADPDQDGIQVDPADPLSGPARFKVSGNTVTFLDAKGFAEKRTGLVRVIYDYKEPGYDGTFVKDTVVDIYDEDSPMVIVRPGDDGLGNNDGSVDVVEGGTTDTYTISLSRALTGSQVVLVKADAIETRTTYGRTAIFKEQVTVGGGVSTDGGSSTVFTFDSTNWKSGITVTVTAIDDDFRDGNDTQVFAPDLQTVNKIRGPIIIEGAGGSGSLSLPAPLLLPHSPPVRFGTTGPVNSEQNILPPDGAVKAFEAGHRAGAVEFMTVLRADLQQVLDDLNNENSNIVIGSTDQILKQLIGKTLEVSSGPGAGTVIDPSRPDDLYNRFWQILDILPVADSLQVKLKLLNPSAVDPDKLYDPADLAANPLASPDPAFARPTTATKYAITALSANFFAREVDQIDYLFMFDNDSVGNDTGTFTSADGVVRQFTPASDATPTPATPATMQVELSSLIAVARLFAQRSDAVDVQTLVNSTIEITVGPGLGRSWKIQSIDTVVGEPDLRQLTLVNGTAGADPTIDSEFRIAGGDSHGRIVGFGMGPNLQVGGRPQPGGITFGDIEVVEAHLGRGDDKVRVDYATNAEDHPTRLRSSADDPLPADFYTQTIIDTGLGKDEVTIKLDVVEDGAFSLNLNAGDDKANATGSTLPLVIFGWDGADQITGGDGNDIIFGDRGRVDYIKTVLTDPDNNPATTGDLVPVDHIITRLGYSAAPNIKNPPVTGATPMTLVDSHANFVKADLIGLSVQAIGTDGHVQFRTIVDVLDAHTLKIDRAWDQTPVFINTDPEDNSAYRISVFPDDQTDGTFRGPRLVLSIASANGGVDTIFGGGGNDIIIGGEAGDIIDGQAGADIVAGDDARLDYQPINVDPGSGLRLDGPTVLIKIDSTRRGDVLHGADTIYGGDGDDLLIGSDGTLIGSDKGDRIDGGAQDDLIFGDNVTLVLKANGNSGDAVNPRYRLVGAGSTLYDANGDALFGTTPQSRPGGNPAWADWTIFLDDTDIANHFGDDYIAGGANNDTIFGQRGNDVIQGDGSIDLKTAANVPYDASATRDMNGLLVIKASVENATDGDDYIEGNAGRDTIFGNLGQDDIIGGNSTIFVWSLLPVARRDDDADWITGGAGTDLDRNNLGDDTASDGHSRDADVILGDNGNIVRLVKPGTGGNVYLSFNYDNYGTSSTERIKVRVAGLADYTPGGPDRFPLSTDQGKGDELHGESGDDQIYGMTGNDVIFGEGQDDVLIAGWGDDWISGGTGDDGILGDDGRMKISRNSTIGEPLYGVAGFAASELNTVISAQNQLQFGIVNVSGLLKYTADLTPDNLDPTGANNTFQRPILADDIIYGGWGTDSIHGGAGDDAVSGAEALAVAFTNNYDINGNKLNGAAIKSGYDTPVNPGNVLGYQTGGANATKFALYDQANALRKILLNQANGTLAANSGAGVVEWLLNFNSNEGPTDTKWIVGTNFSGVQTDGDDHIFGDLGNDWIVGGTGRDSLWAGRGDDLMNADDVLSTNPTTDTNPSYEDLMYGGAGRDVLLINTNGDRAIDWVGEFNSYYTPFSQFGQASVLRLIQPGVPEYLLALSKSEGADQTLSAVYGGAASRNGEPFGELGMVLQEDKSEYGAQNGPPRDDQAGNSKGKVDVQRTAGTQPIYQTASSVTDASSVLLDEAELAAMTEQVKALWRSVPGITDAMLARLDAINVAVGNLEGAELGMMLGDTLLIDADAGGFGWFVDATPGDASEFTLEFGRGVLTAAAGSDAYGHYDLVTVLAHELGHALGFDHEDAVRFPVMRDELDPGTRYVMTAAADPASQDGRLVVGTQVVLNNVIDQLPILLGGNHVVAGAVGSPELPQVALNKAIDHLPTFLGGNHVVGGEGGAGALTAGNSVTRYGSEGTPQIRLGDSLPDIRLNSNAVQSESTDVIVSKNPDGGVKKQDSADLGLDEELLERLKIRLPKGSNSSRQAGAATH